MYRSNTYYNDSTGVIFERTEFLYADHNFGDMFANDPEINE